MLRFDKVWSVADLDCEPTCDLHVEGEPPLTQRTDEEDQRPLGVTREFCPSAAAGAAPAAPAPEGGDAAGSVRVAVVGVEHDGLLLVARYWPGCTEVGYMRAKASAAFHQLGNFCLLHRVRQRHWIVHASLSADMAYLALTTWRRPPALDPSAPATAAPAENTGPFQAFVLRLHPPGTGQGEQTRPPRELRAIARAMQTAETGLPTSQGGNEPGCFTGAGAVEWLLLRHPPLCDNQNRERREHAQALGLKLLQFGVISAVGHDSDRFADDEDLLYRLNAETPPAPGEDSSESDEDDNAMMHAAEQMMTPERATMNDAHRRRRRRKYCQLPTQLNCQGHR